jgi:signal recognition particle receptor subunit alpha
LSKGKDNSPSIWVTEILQGKLAKKLIGKVKLSESDFKPVIEEFKLKLVNKNVAETIAENICKSASIQLLNNTITSLSQVSKILDQVVVDNLVQILSPLRQVDVLREIQESRFKKQVYIILFVGVNGVGKSTSLSKVAYWIQKNELSPMVAACDTFRAGAVEQLRTHCQRLGIPLYERGYEKDPAVVAYEAVKHANRLKMDVLLIDTAGRMQDNEPLMRALSKLINLNKPNLTLFVGEALVGNEASEQLKTFNQRLLDLIDERKHTAVDGIILSKFDTVGDKIGAAISMVYSNNIPIIFLGCGQTYTDLRRFDVETFAKVLSN